MGGLGNHYALTGTDPFAMCLCAGMVHGVVRLKKGGGGGNADIVSVGLIWKATQSIIHGFVQIAQQGQMNSSILQNVLVQLMEPKSEIPLKALVSGFFLSRPP